LHPEGAILLTFSVPKVQKVPEVLSALPYLMKKLIYLHRISSLITGSVLRFLFIMV
jgi:hypothetical protein